MIRGEREAGSSEPDAGAASARAWSRVRRAWPAVLGTWLLVACTHDLDLIQDPPFAVAATTTGPWASMIYFARTDSGLIAIDLGWSGAEDVLLGTARELDGTVEDVRFVFLTHAHRDHIAGWPLVRRARFVIGAAEVPPFTGQGGYRGWVPKLGDELNDYPRPAPDELDLLPIASDTAIALGRDTVWAFGVPGHTPGSTAYLFRGILFGGDAINWRPMVGFQGARAEFSDSVAQSRESLRRLWDRLPPERVRVACSAHGKCGVADSSLRRATLR
ncbi:MAG TPA: MBL fold metallo-hydrolase [Gemmatimonadaceae bacterium]